ncbi:MAG: methylmalonyl-CoA mutase family protein, partial [Gaiellales bacterium]
EERRAADALRDLESAAPSLTTNLMPHIEAAVRARCTVGEISGVLRATWGEFRPFTGF